MKYVSCSICVVTRYLMVRAKQAKRSNLISLSRQQTNPHRDNIEVIGNLTKLRKELGDQLTYTNCKATNLRGKTRGFIDLYNRLISDAKLRRKVLPQH